jgi:hypothetical protein
MSHFDEKSELKGKQATALVALLAQPSVEDAARAAGVTPRTLWRYLRDPIFAAEYKVARRELVGHTIMRLQADASHAARALRTIVDDREAPASARVTAARAIIEHALKGAELTDLMERLDVLEATLKDRPK